MREGNAVLDDVPHVEKRKKKWKENEENANE
jgi:hypothetical protein